MCGECNNNLMLSQPFCWLLTASTATTHKKSRGKIKTKKDLSAKITRAPALLCTVPEIFRVARHKNYFTQIENVKKPSARIKTEKRRRKR